MHLVLERLNLQLVEEGSLGLIDLFTLLNDRHWVNDFNLTSENLSRDLNSLEEASLLRFKMSWTWLNYDIDW